MKKILLLVYVLCFTSVSFSQAKGISIQGLETSKKVTKMPVLTANYSGQDVHFYFIEKNIDSYSDNIRDAVDRSKVFPKAVVFIKQTDGVVIKHQLTNVYLSTYATQNERESFKVHFQNETMNDN